MDQINMSSEILPYKDIMPTLADDVFIAPGARIIGNVEIGAGSSIWYNSVVRGDVEPIRIGTGTNVQDGSILHVSGGSFSCTLGNDILIGHMCIIHGCDLKDRAFVGMGSIILDGCIMESDSMLAAGAMLTPGKVIPSGELWAGRPAKLMRLLSPEEIVSNKAQTAHYAAQAQLHRRSLAL